MPLVLMPEASFALLEWHPSLGNGWISERHEIVRLPVPGVEGGLEMNQCVVQKGESKCTVASWCQSHGRAIANEYKVKQSSLTRSPRIEPIPRSSK